MKLLVTGGAGFIGSAVIRTAIAVGHESINVDKLTYASNLKSIASVANNPLYQFEKADICSSKTMTMVLEKHKPEFVNENSSFYLQFLKRPNLAYSVLPW